MQQILFFDHPEETVTEGANSQLGLAWQYVGSMSVQDYDLSNMFGECKSIGCEYGIEGDFNFVASLGGED